MANAAVGETFNANFSFGRAQAEIMPKRKTPSELRGEQLKRRSFEKSAVSKPVTLLVSDRITSGGIHGLKKPEPSKTPKYIDTRVNDVFPVKKSSNRCRVLNGQEKLKDILNTGKVVHLDHIYKPSACTNAEKNIDSCDKAGEPDISESSVPISTNSVQTFQKAEKCVDNTFRSVAELSLGKEKSSGSTRIDMDKVLKGLVARGISFDSTIGSSQTSNEHHSILPKRNCTEHNLPGNKTPLDFTLKTTIRLLSSSSVKWLHRLISAESCNVIGDFSCLYGGSDQNLGCKSSLASADALFRKALHSWVYPQSSLPSSVVSAMSSGSRLEMDFLSKRQQGWEDSFRNLYYMLRQKRSGVFYVCTSQFVALFVGVLSGRKKNSCSAYMSQSTHGLRSLLAEHDICFSMPLCRSKVEQATADDLVELSEIERHNFGQTYQLDSSSDVDNTPQSLLAFVGNKNVHAFYDFILNYRTFLTSLTSFDVPVLCSPMPFQNASISTPEVRCKEMKRADLIPSSSMSDIDDAEHLRNPSVSSLSYSVEIKDAFIPPWVISRICAAMGSQETSFEASFTTDPKSFGLNVALDLLCCNSDANSDGTPIDGSKTVGISEAVAFQWLQPASLRSLKYTKGSYTAHITPL